MGLAEIKQLYPDGDNEIHPSARIGKGVTLGRFNRIAAGVSIEGDVVIGDCNEINENVRFIGPGAIRIGDWNKIHNNVLLMGGKSLTMGHNCWIGQNSVLDGNGELELHNGVIIGWACQIWTHVSKGEQIEGCNLLNYRKSVFEDDCWFVGTSHASPGIRVGKRAQAMLGAVVTKDMEPGSVYGGVPAVKLNLSYFEPVTQQKKFAMMGEWADEFCVYWNGPRYFNLWAGVIQIGDSRLGNEKIYVAATHDFQCPDSTVFYLDTKTYTKHLGKLERDFIAFLLTNKARFIPEGN